MNKKIAVAGMGYVGLSNAVLLSRHNQVTACDIVKEKVDLVNRGKSPIADPELEEYLAGASPCVPSPARRRPTGTRNLSLSRLPPTMIRKKIILIQALWRR